MRNFIITICALLVCGSVSAQSKTTEALHKKYSESLSLFFYNNTLRMLNQTEDKAYDELIKDIEKMKFLMIEKAQSFTGADYKKLVSGYKGESFEEIMTSRFQGKNFDVLLKESGGKTKGMIVLINDSSSLYVLDIVGSIALDKVTSLYSTLDKSSDIGKRIKDFTGRHDERSKRKDDDDEDNDN
jgi:hypothetical protein